MREAFAVLTETTGVPGPRIQIPYIVALLAAHFDEALSAMTHKPPKAPLAGVSLAAAAVAYLPISNLFTLNATVAEHWLYVPSAFLFAAAAQSLFVAPQWLRRSAIALISVWTLWLGVRTWQRQGDWVDQRTFLTRTIEAGGDKERRRHGRPTQPPAQPPTTVAAAPTKAPEPTAVPAPTEIPLEVPH